MTAWGLSGASLLVPSEKHTRHSLDNPGAGEARQNESDFHMDNWMDGITRYNPDAPAVGGARNDNLNNPTLQAAAS